MFEHKVSTKTAPPNCSVHASTDHFVLIPLTFQKTLLATRRSSHPEVSHKKGVIRNFAKFTGKHLWQSLPETCNFIKKETLPQVWRTPFFIEHLCWLLLYLPTTYKKYIWNISKRATALEFSKNWKIFRNHVLIRE